LDGSQNLVLDAHAGTLRGDDGRTSAKTPLAFLVLLTITTLEWALRKSWQIKRS
jgi:hypothetical protein